MLLNITMYFEGFEQVAEKYREDHIEKLKHLYGNDPHFKDFLEAQIELTKNRTTKQIAEEMFFDRAYEIQQQLKTGEKQDETN